MSQSDSNISPNDLQVDIELPDGETVTAEYYPFSGVDAWFIPAEEPRGRQQGSRIYQIAGRSYTKNSVVKEIKAKNKPQYEATKELKELVEIVKEIIDQHNYERVCVVTHMATELIIREEIGLSEDQTMHFYNLRGRNDFKDCDCLFVLGTPYPSVRTILNAAIALDPNRAIEFFTINGKPMPKYTHVQREFRFSPDGLACWQAEHGTQSNGAANIVGQYNDEMMGSILEMFREAEIEQAAFRARPITNDKVDVWIFSNIPCQNIELDGLWDEAPIAPSGVNWKLWKKIKKYHDSLPNGAEYGYLELAQETGSSLSGLKHLKILDVIAANLGPEVERGRAKTEGATKPREIIRKGKVQNKAEKK